MNALYKTGDLFFFIFHIGLIAFNLFGWIFKPLRKWNLITLGLTAFSWFVLGYFYGFGYCFLTDWHWAIRERLGYPNPFNSYIQFLISSVLSISIPEDAANIVTATLFFLAVIMSLVTNIRDRQRKSR